MELKSKGLYYFLSSACCVAFSGVVISSPSLHGYKGEGYYKGEAPLKAHDHFEVIGAGGIAKLKAGNSELGVTSSETDRLVQTNSNSWNTQAGQLGIGYLHYLNFTPQSSEKYSNNVKWFSSIEPQLNIYQLSSNSIKGDVWRFNSPAFNQLKYDIPFHSTRVMLDAALAIATWNRFSLYAKGGIGNAWNRVSYSDSDNGNSDCIEQNVKLNSNTSSKFVWEAGIGAILAFNDRFGLSLEYLYTDLGTVKTSSNGNFGTLTTPLVSAPSFNVRSQTALLGLHIAI